MRSRAPGRKRLADASVRLSPAAPLDFAGGAMFVMSLRSALASAPSSARTPVRTRVDGVGMTAGQGGGKELT